MGLIIINCSLSNSYLGTNYRKICSVLYGLWLHCTAVQLRDKIHFLLDGSLATTHHQEGEYAVSSEIRRHGVPVFQVYCLRMCEARITRNCFPMAQLQNSAKLKCESNQEVLYLLTQKNYLYSSPNIIRVIKSRRMRWAGHVARTGERRGLYRVLVGKPEGKNHLEDPGVDGRIILRWTHRKWDMRAWTRSVWLRIGTGGGHLWMR